MTVNNIYLLNIAEPKKSFKSSHLRAHTLQSKFKEIKYGFGPELATRRNQEVYLNSFIAKRTIKAKLLRFMSLAQQYADFANEIRIKCHYKLNDTQILNNYVTTS